MQSFHCEVPVDSVVQTIENAKKLLKFFDPVIVITFVSLIGTWYFLRKSSLTSKASWFFIINGFAYFILFVTAASFVVSLPYVFPIVIYWPVSMGVGLIFLSILLWFLYKKQYKNQVQSETSQHLSIGMMGIFFIAGIVTSVFTLSYTLPLTNIKTSATEVRSFESKQECYDQGGQFKGTYTIPDDLY